MEKKLAVRFDVTDHKVTFFFNEPVHILTFAISSSAGEILWKVTPRAMQLTSNAQGSFSSKRLEDAGPAELEKLRAAQLEGAMSGAKTVDRIVYGEVPEGYKEKTPATRLQKGETYNALIISEEGHAAAAFTA